MNGIPFEWSNRQILNKRTIFKNVLNKTLEIENNIQKAACFLDWNRHSNVNLDWQIAIVVSDIFFILNNNFEIVNRFFGLMTYNQSFLFLSLLNSPLNQCSTIYIKDIFKNLEKYTNHYSTVFYWKSQKPINDKTMSFHLHYVIVSP